MVSHVLLTFYRSLSRHRLYAALNVLGLALGVAVFLVLTLVVRYESNFDRWLPHASHVYRLDQTLMFPGQPTVENSGVTFVAYDLLRTDFPQIMAGTRLFERDLPVSAGTIIDSESVTYVDPGFFRVFELPLVSGDWSTALSEPSSVVLTQAAARKYFGTARARGRSIDISKDGIKHSFTVSAVMKDLPGATTLTFSILAPLTPAVETGEQGFQSWGSEEGETYLRFRTTTDAKAVAAGLRDFVSRRAAGTGPDTLGPRPADSMALGLVALPDAHFHDVNIETTPPGVDRRVVLSLGAIGVLALITAAINYINLATARSDLRAREVALRKVMGATRRMLLAQFLAEALALVALAALIGLALTELAMPVVDALGGWAVRIDYLRVVPLLGGLVLVIGIGAGLYPAMLLSGYQPAAVLAAVRTPAGGRLGSRLRGLLVLAQFAGAIGFAICTLVIDQQAAFMRTADRGFDRQGLIVVQSLSAQELIPRQDAIISALRRVLGVISATRSDQQPNTDSRINEFVSRPGLVGPSPILAIQAIGRDYFSTYGIRLIAGRLFDDAHPADDRAGDLTGKHVASAVLNARAVKTLGFPDPRAAIGKTMTVGLRSEYKPRLQIIGVVRNVRFMSPREPVDPEIYRYDTHGFQYAEATIRYRGVPRAAMMDRLQAAWRSVAPDNPFVAKTAEERLADFFRPDEQRARLFSAGAVLAVAIACLGLYGLASFNTTRRVREIGIRKTLGASTRDVLLLLVFQFIRPVLIANVIAWPIAWAAMRGWLSGFDQRIALSPLYFVAVGVAALVLSILTVLGQAWLVARAEPARALRYE